MSGLDYVCVNTDGQSNWQNAEMSPTTTAAGFPDGDTIKYGIKLDVSSLSTGNHAICVAARGKDGTAIMKSFTVHVVNTAPQLTVDQNLNNMDTYGTLSLSGTASNISGLAYVCVNTDGQNNWQNATLTQTAAAAGFPDGGTEKYALKLDLSSLSEGNHLITIAARGNDDHLVMQNYTIHVVKTDPQITLDQDIDGKNASGTLTLSGTASNNSGIDYVCVNTDGQNNWQNATLTQATAADGFGDGDTVKYSLNLDTSTLSAGTHSIWISARGKDGSSVTKSLTVKIASKEPEITINQSPDGTEVNGAVALSGTASNSSGMDYVCVNTDGQNNWTNANLTSTTPADGFADGDTVNYNLTLDVSSLSLGTHSIWIAARGKDGTTVMKSLVVYVRNTEDHISLDQNMANASIGDTLDFSGIALDNAGVQNVILNIDGVNAWYSPVELADDSAMGNGIVERFHFSVDTSGLSAGAHSVTLLVNKKDGSQGDRFFFQVQKKGAGLTIDQAENSTLNLNGATLSGQVDDVSSLSQLTARSDDKQLLGTLAASQLSSGKFSFTLPHLTPGPHLITFDLHTKSGADIQVDRQFIAGGTVNQASYSFSESAFAAKNKSYVAGYEKYGVRAMQDADINPSAIMDTEDGPYEMMALDFSAFQTADRATLIDGLNHLLSGCGVLNGKGEAFYEAGKASDVNPIYLVAHARIESGNGSSYLSTGRSPTDGHATGCYNQFGINAYDADPRNGNSYAMQQGWTTVDKSIYGGAQWIAEHYIHNSQHGGSYDQNTLYEMRWNPEGYQMHGYLCYQYATEPDWAASIAAIANSYPSIFNGISLHFIYPVYQ
ncbi:MAG TPA: hypothetical protein DEP42_02640 [Ruminococcaceae bacterium]|nr:hypothetical protein [Oscillospiraceae bacterium]